MPVNTTTAGPYRADIWHRSTNLDDIGDRDRFNVVGPNLVGGWHGTVPQSQDGMTEENARRLADLLNLAYKAGVMNARAIIRGALGL